MPKIYLPQYDVTINAPDDKPLDQIQAEIEAKKPEIEAYASQRMGVSPEQFQQAQGAAFGQQKIPLAEGPDYNLSARIARTPIAGPLVTEPAKALERGFRKTAASIGGAGVEAAGGAFATMTQGLRDIGLEQPLGAPIPNPLEGQSQVARQTFQPDLPRLQPSQRMQDTTYTGALSEMATGEGPSGGRGRAAVDFGTKLVSDTLGIAPSMAATVAGFLMAGPAGAGAMGGFLEGASQYEKAKAEGKSEQKALQELTTVGVGTGVLNAIPFIKAFDKVLPDQLKGYAANFLLRGAVKGATETAEGALPPLAELERVPRTTKEATDLLVNMGAGIYDESGVFLPAMITGGLMGGGATAPRSPAAEQAPSNIGQYFARRGTQTLTPPTSGVDVLGPQLQTLRRPQGPIAQPEIKETQVPPVAPEPQIVDLGETQVRQTPKKLQRFETLFDEAAAQTQGAVWPELLIAQAQVESGGNPKAVSPKGAQGLMQFMPPTAKEMGITDPFDPRQSVMGAARFMQDALEKSGGDLDVALAIYNAGYGNVQKYGGVPPFKETQEYIRKVRSAMAAIQGDTVTASLLRTPPDKLQQIVDTRVNKGKPVTAKEVKEIIGEGDKESVKPVRDWVNQQVEALPPVEEVAPLPELRAAQAPEVAPSPATPLPESILASFPDLLINDSGLISINQFTQAERDALREAGLIEEGTLSTGEKASGVDPEKLWPLRQAAQAAQKPRKVDEGEAAAARERRASFYDRLAEEQESLGEYGDQEAAEKYRAKAAEIRSRRPASGTAQPASNLSKSPELPTAAAPVAQPAPQPQQEGGEFYGMRQEAQGRQGEVTPAQQAGGVQVPPPAKQPWEMTREEFERERPAVEGYLYHGSPDGDISQLDPYFHTKPWEEGQGPYATTDRNIAAGYARGRTAKGERKISAEDKGRVNYIKSEAVNILNLDAPYAPDTWSGIFSELGINASDFDNAPSTNYEAMQEARSLLSEEMGSRTDAYYALEDAIRNQGFDATTHTEGKSGTPHLVTVFKGDIGVNKDGSPFDTLKGKVVSPETVHREAIEAALSSGKPVPASVLADYPDLAEKYQQPSARTQTLQTAAQNKPIKLKVYRGEMGNIGESGKHLQGMQTIDEVISGKRRDDVDLAPLDFYTENPSDAERYANAEQEMIKALRAKGSPDPEESFRVLWGREPRGRGVVNEMEVEVSNPLDLRPLGSVVDYNDAVEFLAKVEGIPIPQKGKDRATDPDWLALDRLMERLGIDDLAGEAEQFLAYMLMRNGPKESWRKNKGTEFVDWVKSKGYDSIRYTEGDSDHIAVIRNANTPQNARQQALSTAAQNLAAIEGKAEPVVSEGQNRAFDRLVGMSDVDRQGRTKDLETGKQRKLKKGERVVDDRSSDAIQREQTARSEFREALAAEAGTVSPKEQARREALARWSAKHKTSFQESIAVGDLIRSDYQKAASTELPTSRLLEMIQSGVEEGAITQQQAKDAAASVQRFRGESPAPPSEPQAIAQPSEQPPLTFRRVKVGKKNAYDTTVAGRNVTIDRTAAEPGLPFEVRVEGQSAPVDFFRTLGEAKDYISNTLRQEMEAEAQGDVEPAQPVVKQELTTEPKRKEPWEMTQEEWLNDPVKRRMEAQEAGVKGTERQRIVGKGIDSRIKNYNDPPDNEQVYLYAVESHKNAIERALSQGKPVPPAVLADYPDLAAKYAQPTPEESSVVAPQPSGETGQLAEASQPWKMTMEEYVASRAAEYPDLDAESLTSQKKLWEDRWLASFNEGDPDKNIPRAVFDSLPDGYKKVIVQTNNSVKEMLGLKEIGKLRPVQNYIPDPEGNRKRFDEIRFAEGIADVTLKQYRLREKRSSPAMSPGRWKEASERHRNAVETLLKYNQPVKPEVLADYPDLAAKYAQPTPKESSVIAPQPSGETGQLATPRPIWKMPFKQYAKERMASENLTDPRDIAEREQELRRVHRRAVQDAIAAGEKVPVANVKEYGGGETAAAPAKAEGQPKQPWEMTREEFETAKLPESSRDAPSVLSAPLFHGTDANFSATQFQMGMKGTNDLGLLGQVETERAGIFLSDNKDFASEFGKNVMPVRAIMESVADVDETKQGFIDSLPLDNDLRRRAYYSNQPWGMFEGGLGKAYVEYLKQEGYDSAFFNEETTKADGGYIEGGTFVVFDPKQVLPNEHKAVVDQAIASGKPVPASVLAEYPDLAAKASTPAQPAPAAGKGSRLVGLTDTEQKVFDALHSEGSFVDEIHQAIKGKSLSETLSAAYSLRDKGYAKELSGKRFTPESAQRIDLAEKTAQRQQSAQPPTPTSATILSDLRDQAREEGLNPIEQKKRNDRLRQAFDEQYPGSGGKAFSDFMRTGNPPKKPKRGADPTNPQAGVVNLDAPKAAWDAFSDFMFRQTVGPFTKSRPMGVAEAEAFRVARRAQEGVANRGNLQKENALITFKRALRQRVGGESFTRTEKQLVSRASDLSRKDKRIRTALAPKNATKADVMQSVRDVLDGKSKVLLLPEKVYNASEGMRDLLAAGGDFVVENGIASFEGLITAIKDNVGFWLRRSYRVHKDPNWVKTVQGRPEWNAALDAMEKEWREFVDTPEKQTDLELIQFGRRHLPGVKNAKALNEIEAALKDDPNNETLGPEARAKVEEALRALGKPDRDQLEIRLIEMLQEMSNEGRENFANRRLGSQNRSSFMRRNEIPKWLRDVMGEYHDTEINFALSSEAMTQMISAWTFSQKLYELGYNKFIFNTREEIPASLKGSHYTKVPDNPKYGMLAGKYTSQEMKDAIDQKIAEAGTIGKLFNTLSGTIRWFLTIGNVATGGGIRNFVTSGIGAMLRGDIPIATGTKFFRVLNKERAIMPALAKSLNMEYTSELGMLKALAQHHLEMVERGVHDSDPNFNLAKDRLKDSFLNDLLTGKLGEESYLDVPREKVLALKRKMENLWLFGDNFWKSVSHAETMNRWSPYAKKQRWSEQRLRDYIDGAIRGVTPTYAETYEIINRMKRTGTGAVYQDFITWSAERFRNKVNLVRLIRDELATGDKTLMASAAMRIATLAGGHLAFTALLAVIGKWALGSDSDDEDWAVRQFVPAWMNNSAIAYLGNRGEDGNYRIADLSYSDPDAWMNKMIFSAFQGDWDEVPKTFAETFFGVAIAAELTAELMTNTKGNQQPIWLSTDSLTDWVAKVGRHVIFRAGGTPAKLAVHAYEKAHGKQEEIGARSLQDQLKSATGASVYTVNPKENTRHYALKTAAQFRAISKQITDSMTKYPNQDEKALREKYGNQRNKSAEELVRIGVAGRETGLTQNQIRQIFKDASIRQDYIAKIMMAIERSYTDMKKTGVRDFSVQLPTGDKAKGGGGLFETLKPMEIMKPLTIPGL